jgi:site-specific DNA-methyltransferase (adenine-specific)
VDQILQERVKNEHGKSVYKTTDSGDAVLGKAKKGVPLGDVWNIPYLNPKANERVGYPTQKPILLLERIIEISTDRNDVVLDPFCGSGTTLVAAHLRGRNYIGIDQSPDAIRISEERLTHPTKTLSYLLEKGESEYINKTDGETQILKCLDAIPVQRNSGIDGFLKSGHYEKPVPVKIQKPNETLAQAKRKLVLEANKRNCDLMIMVRTHNDNQEQIALDSHYMDDRNILVVDSYELSLESW